MTTSRKIVLGAAGLVLLMIAGYALFRPAREPEYQGEPLSYWLEWCGGLMDRDRTNTTLAPNQAIAHFGTNSIPWLLKYVQYHPPAWYHSSNRWCRPMQKFFNSRFAAKANRARGAVRTFEMLGSNAAGAIPRLEQMIPKLRSEDPPYALSALAAIGEQGFPSLCAALTNRQLRCRGSVAWAIGKYGATNARPAVPLLLQCAGETNPAVAGDAIFALGRLELDPGLVVPVITPRLCDPDPDVRLKTALALAHYGPVASNAIPALRKALNDPDGRVAQMAQAALWKIDSNSLPKAPSP